MKFSNGLLTPLRCRGSRRASVSDVQSGEVMMQGHVPGDVATTMPRTGDGWRWAMGGLSIVEPRAKGLGVTGRLTMVAINLHGARFPTRGSQWPLLGDYFVKALDTGQPRRIFYRAIAIAISIPPK